MSSKFDEYVSSGAEIPERLSADEMLLLQAYRTCSDLDRRAAITLLSLLLKSVMGPTGNNKVIEFSKHRNRGE